MMFLASFVLKGHRARWDWEIIMEMNSEEIDTFRKNAATRQLDSLTPSDATKAREALHGDHRAGHPAIDDQGRSPSRASPSDGGPRRRLSGI